MGSLLTEHWRKGSWVVSAAASDRIHKAPLGSVELRVRNQKEKLLLFRRPRRSGSHQQPYAPSQPGVEAR